VSHNQFHDCFFASCDDEGQVVLWDTRNAKQPVYHYTAGKGIVYSVQFSPLNKNVFCTGGEEQLIKVWDVRNLSEPLVALNECNGQEITQLKWSHDEREMLWVAAGNNLTMWDLNEQKAKFVHSGHMQTIKQMDLHPIEPRTVASVDEDNDIHIFQPTRNAAL
jgi:histone-binding protein RBBP4